jgi:ABC-type branched-subunit amino acid transport system substrate-binding protein
MRNTVFALVLGVAIAVVGAVIYGFVGPTLLSSGGGGRTVNGVSADAIVFGQVAALEGPVAALGLGMKTGIEAAFSEVNSIGGVKGRKLSLTSVDDGYEPMRASAMARQLIFRDRVFAMIGPVGTPTSVEVEKVASDAQVPLIGAFTGAEVLRDPDNANVINLRASYFQETAAMVDHLVADLGINRIAVFYQNDAFGQAGLVGVKHALDQRQTALLAEGSYERNTVDVRPALTSIEKANPQAVIMIGAYEPCAEFIRAARAAKFDPIFLNISFVGGESLARALGPIGAGVVVTQVVPFPKDTRIRIVKDYQAALKQLNPNAVPDFVSLEGYLVGRLTIAALSKIDGAVTRTALLDAVRRTENFDLGGLRLQFATGKNQGSDEVFLTVIQPDGSLQAVDRLQKSSG